MIGKEIRSIRQLAKESGTSLRSAIINFGQYGMSYCKIIWFEKYKLASNTECLFIFNNQYNYGMSRISSVLSLPEFDKTREEISSHYGRLIGIGVNDYMSRDLRILINGIHLLPESFEEDFNKFINENQKTVNTLIHKYGFSPNDAHIKRIYASTGDSKNFFEWAINSHYRCGTTINAIKRILWWNDNYKQLVKKLSKGTITAYTTNKDINKLFDEICNLRREKRINDSINLFNTAQKKILRAMDISEDDKKVFSSFYRLSESKKINFVKKMSTITDASEIMRQMRHITSTHFNWNKESFMDYIENVEGVNYEKIFDKGNTVVVKVNDFETVKQLAKTTNWCISKNKSYWNNYVEHVRNAEQFILFDFAQKEDSLTSIVGFTCRYNKGITNAHDFINNNMMDNGGISAQSLINSYFSHLKNNCGIYSLLESHGVDINLVAKYDKPLYDWNKETMYKYLYECVDKNNVLVLVDNGGYVAISVKDANVKYFLGDSYMDNIDSDYYPYQHIIFMNFNMNQHDPNRIMFAIINNGREGNEDSVLMFKNEHCIDADISFETKLSQFGLPYDTIKRVDDEYIRLRDAISSYNTKEIIKGMKNKEVFDEVFYECFGENTMSEFIRTSIVTYGSFDYLNIFYDNGIKLSNYFSHSRLQSLITDLLSNFITSYGGNRPCCLPTHKEIDEFFNRETTSLTEAARICLFLAIDKILATELNDVKTNESLYRKPLNLILSANARGSAIDHFIEVMLDNFDTTKKSDSLNFILAHALTRGGDKLRDKIEELKAKSEYIATEAVKFEESLKRNFDEQAKEIPEEEFGREIVDNVEEDGMNIPEFEGDYAEAVV